MIADYVDYLIDSFGWSFLWMLVGYLVAKIEVEMTRHHHRSHHHRREKGN